ncbi:DrmB family protein [Amycolatopsis sp. NPDC049868]|uniref:DrmB family protein n=1 Tax=Amycolatopsis sp. NPDC049868 TaxID=3363934 RepID=UPI0037B83924
MTTAEPQAHRVGAMRPNQLLHTYGAGAMADLPNLSVVMLGLDFWNLERSHVVQEERLLSAVRAKLGRQVTALRLPPYLPETPDPFGQWTKVGVPVGLFPGWLRCSRCNRLGEATSGLFDLEPDPVRPDHVRYAHKCWGSGKKRPAALPARFVLACENGHLDDFPWHFYSHRGVQPESGHSLRMTESGSTGEAANVFVTCECNARRSMSEAFGEAAEFSLPGCRGRHPHLPGKFDECGRPVRTLVLGATNSWFPTQLRAFTVPRDRDPLMHVVAEFWKELEILAKLPEEVAKQIIPNQNCWPDLERYGIDKVWRAVVERARHRPCDERRGDSVDLYQPEWDALTSDRAANQPNFTTVRESVPENAGSWLNRLVLVPRLREVAALYGFTRIDAPEWEAQDTPDQRRAPLSLSEPTWVPCAETRGEGFFLRFDEDRVARWEARPEVCQRERDVLLPAHRSWCRQRDVDAGGWPGMRYVLLHTFAHTLIRELALDSGYSAAGIGERIYARSATEGGQTPMAGILLYTAAPDSEGTLGGLVSLGKTERLGQLVDQALEAAELCSSDPLCSEHDPRVHGRLYGAACHACLFAAETSCERGNQYLDRALLVDTLGTTGCGFFSD